MKRNPLIILFDFLSDTVNGGERALLDFLSALVPYGVPVIPAYLTYTHMQNILGFDQYIAGVSAFVVEVLGMASMSTAVRFYRHNQKYKSGENRAPFWLALGTYVFYIVVVLWVNVILEVEAAQRTASMIWAIALFSSLGIPSGVLVSIRAQHREILEEREDARQRNRPAAQQASAPAAEPRAPKTKHASDYREKIIAIAQAHYAKTGDVIAPKAVTAKLNIDHDKNKGYVSTTVNTWAKEQGIERKNPLTF